MLFRARDLLCLRFTWGPAVASRLGGKPYPTWRGCSGWFRGTERLYVAVAHLYTGITSLFLLCFLCLRSAFDAHSHTHKLPSSAMSDHDASASGADTKREEGEAAASAGEGQVVVVTGGNKGIGFEVCRQVAVAWPTADVILASRDQGRGEAAVATLTSDGVTNVRFLATLDVGSAESVAAFAAALAAAVPRVDVLVNNAGVFVVRRRMQFHAFHPRSYPPVLPVR